MIQFFIPGAVATKGSVKAFARNGRAWVVNDNPREKDFRARAAMAAAAAMNGVQPFHEPIVLEALLLLPRPKGHFARDGALAKSAPRIPWTRPDWDKVARSLGDALSGIVYRDDSLVAQALVTKRYANDNEHDEVTLIIGVYVKVYPAAHCYALLVGSEAERWVEQQIAGGVP